MEVLQLRQFTNFLQPRARDSHKGHFGHLLIIGGNFGYFGSVHLAAYAALRVGAGLVSVVTRSKNAAILAGICPEIMCHGVEAAEEINSLLDKVTTIVIGPGLGLDEWGRSLLALALKVEKPLIIDADGLNILAQDPPAKRSDWILTPHPGEAGRLLKMDSKEVQSNRVAAINKIQAQFGGTIVLKGADTLVSTFDSRPVICKAGNPGMATAGMGDVLSGVIGGLVAQHLSLADAAKLGVLLHAMAGDIAAKEEGERGMIASDLTAHLRRLVNYNE